MATYVKRDNGKWQAKVRRRGQPPVSQAFDRKSDAVKWATALEREMDIGAFINRDDAERTTFGDAAKRYSEEAQSSNSDKAPSASRIKRLVETFGAYSLAAISAPMLAAYRDDRLKVVGNQTVKHELGMVSRIFKTAAMDWGIALPHGIPTALVRKPKVDNGRTRRLELTEEAALLDALQTCESPWPGAAAVLAVETAGRMGELLSLTWAEVDLTLQTARLRGADGGKTKNRDVFRDVPLSKRAVALLTSLPRSAKGRVLPLSQNALQLSWIRAVARARKAHVHSLLCSQLQMRGFDGDDCAREIRALVYKKKKPEPVTIELLEDIESKNEFLRDLTFHDLRHEATSRLAEKLSLHELMKVTGHKSSTMLARYYHPRASDLAKKIG